ncbi:YcjF family protein [Helicobacter pylori]
MWRICALKRLLVGFKRELLSFAKNWNIPTIVVFTNTQAEAGEAFVQESKGIIDEEWGFKGFVRAYVRVNSVAFSFRGLKVLVEGLEELVDETKKYLSDAIKNKKNHFLSIQKVKIQERKQAMIEECKTIIHVASGAAGAAGLIPIPFSDMPLIAGIQTGMIYEMNDAFGMDLDKSVGASLVAGLLGVTTVAQVGRTLVNGLLKFIPVVGSVVGGATAAVITEALGFVYLKVLEYYYNDEMGEVDLPGEVGMITSLFKENYLNLDTIKKLTQ